MDLHGSQRSWWQRKHLKRIKRDLDYVLDGRKHQHDIQNENLERRCYVRLEHAVLDGNG